MKSYQQPVESLELKPFIFQDETNELTNYLWQHPGSWIVRRALDPVTKQVDDQHLVVVYSKKSLDTADVVSLRIGYFEIFEGQHQVWEGWMQNGSFSLAFNQWKEGGDQIRSALQQPNIILGQKKLLDIDKTVFLSSLSQMLQQGPWDQNNLLFPTESQIDLTLSAYCMNDQKAQAQRGNWSPDPNKVKQIADWFMDKSPFGKENDKFFKNKDELNEFYIKAAKVILFLQNEDAVFYQLKRLNELLGREQIHKRSLRNALEKEVGLLQFQSTMGKALDLLTSKEFLDTVRQGIHFKDIGAGVTHGEFTHTIQWLLLGWQQQNTNFLGVNVIDFYRQIGGAKVGEKVTLDDNTSSSTFWLSQMWNHIFDQLQRDSTKDFDATSPEKLNRYILESKDELPFLVEAILAPTKAKIIKYEKLEKERQEIVKFYGQDDSIGIWNKKLKEQQEAKSKKDEDRYDVIRKGFLYHPKKKT